MVYLFLTCTRTEKAATSSNIFIRSEPGSSAIVTTAAPAPATTTLAPAISTPAPATTLVYYPVHVPVRRRRQVRAGAGAGVGESRALAAGCLLPLLGLVLTSLVCFITVIIILCSMSYFINK